MAEIEGPSPVPLTRMRRAIARSMTASAQVPQFTVEWEADVRSAGALREQLRIGGQHFSFVDFLVAATSRALREHPPMNASFSDEGIVQHDVINIGIAVSLDDGLVAPAIRGSDQLTLPALAAERRRLTAAALDGSLEAADVLSTTFTLSNLGPFGVRRFRALVVPPQAAILAVGAATQTGEVSLSLSCDHRAIDGAPAAVFLRDVVALIEEPVWLNGLLDTAGA
jgi:pyruvate dehydrogenase E2 component (dihydrolipoamide acetyltransferase)